VTVAELTEQLSDAPSRFPGERSPALTRTPPEDRGTPDLIRF
jgi:hypothetical protein